MSLGMSLFKGTDSLCGIIIVIFILNIGILFFLLIIPNGPKAPLNIKSAVTRWQLRAR
jgi:hypothetical protein